MNNISIRNLYKSYSDKTVLKNLSLDIPVGGRVAVMGNSGCGKTTLVNIILGLEKQDEGVIEGLPTRVSAVFQEDRLCEDFSALSNVRMVLNQKDSNNVAKNVLIALGLEQALDKPVKNLSGGMKRRVAIARAIVAQSDFVILDEPFKGLDEETKCSVINYVNTVLRNKTILLITHDVDEAKSLCAEIYQMNERGELNRI